MITDHAAEWEAPAPAVGLHRAFLLLLGAAAALLGAVGLVFPIIPGVALLAAAATCFARSAPALHDWLLGLPMVGRVIRRVNEAPPMAWHWRLLLAFALWGVALYAVVLGTKVFWLRAAVLAAAMVLTLVLLVLPESEPPLRARRRLMRAGV